MEKEKSDEKALGNLLDSFRETGQLESRGSFTMAGRKAAGKLANSLLPDPADWILKVVQGACQAGAQSLSVSQTSKATHIELRLPYLLDIRSVEKSLTQGTSASQPGVDDLCTALRVVGLGQDRSWVARLKTGETTHWVLVKAGAVSLETVTGQDGTPGQTEILIGIAFPPGQSGKVGGVRFGAAIQNEHEALHQRARGCPIPLLLDGTRLDTLQRTDGLGGFEHEAFLGVAMGTDPGELASPARRSRYADHKDFPGPAAYPGLQPICLPAGLSQSGGSTLGDRFRDPKPFFLPPPLTPQRMGSSFLRVAFRYQSERHARDGRTWLFRPLPTPSRVLLVRHGVVVGKRNLGLTEAVAVDVYLNANSTRSDLSGLEVEVTPEHLEAAREEILGIGPFLQDLGRLLTGHTSKPKNREVVLYGGATGLALALAPWPLKLLAAGMAAFKLREAAQQYQMVVRDCAQEVTLFQLRYCHDEAALSKQA